MIIMLDNADMCWQLDIDELAQVFQSMTLELIL